jgi:hypothetical protein
MSVETTIAHDAVNNKRTIDKRSLVGSWEIHSWGDGKCSGMAAVSAITTLQIGATLTPIPADQVALNKAAEYLLDALAPQLKLLLRTLVADGSDPKCPDQDKVASEQAELFVPTWRTSRSI